MSTSPAARGIAGPNHCKYRLYCSSAGLGNYWGLLGVHFEPYDNNTDRAEQSTAA